MFALFLFSLIIVYHTYCIMSSTFLKFFCICGNRIFWYAYYACTLVNNDNRLWLINSCCLSFYLLYAKYDWYDWIDELSSIWNYRASKYFTVAKSIQIHGWYILLELMYKKIVWQVETDEQKNSLVNGRLLFDFINRKNKPKINTLFDIQHIVQ